MSHIELISLGRQDALLGIVDSLFKVIYAAGEKYIEYVNSAWVEFEADKGILRQYGRASNGFMFSEYFNHQLTTYTGSKGSVSIDVR